MNKVKLYWTLQIGGWLLFALVQISGFILIGRSSFTLSQGIFWFLEAALFLFATHIFRYFMITQGWLAYNMTRLIPRVLMAVFVLAVAVYALRTLVTIPLNMYRPEVAWSSTNFIGLVLVYALIFFLWSAIYFIYHYFDRYNNSLKHEAAMNEIELKNLKSQLNPHFIFNALNSIRALVDENPAKSKTSITRLSNILRSSLISDKKRLTSFKDELKIVKDYLGLESIRFEERLRVSYQIHPDSYMYMVPPLMLQTLVENGVKHGISKLKEGGFIKLNTAIVDDKFVITISNSGKMEKLNGQTTRKTGLGLRNSRQRLEILYGDLASLNIKNENSAVVTELIIPQKSYESINNR